MLYDKRWDAKVQADPLSLESLIAWLEKQPAHESYCYLSNGNCLLAQYLSAHGFRNVRVLGFGAFNHAEGSGFLPREFWFTIANDDNDTFGGALKRARRVQRGWCPRSWWPWW